MPIAFIPYNKIVTLLPRFLSFFYRLSLRSSLSWQLRDNGATIEFFKIHVRYILYIKRELERRT